MINEKTLISVIIPVYNDFKRLKKCIHSLMEQTFEPLEIIIVDNNSTLEEKEKIKNLVCNKSNLIMLEEDKIQGSYAARNKGLKYAKGDIIAFTDSDCIPKSNWIEKIKEGFIKKETDAIAGRIEFIFNDKDSLGEIVDSLISMQNKEKVRRRGVAVTANLAVKKSIFNKIGLFNPNLKSGGDINWTNKLTKLGFDLMYDEKMVVEHPTRNEKQLLKKRKRVVEGKINSMKGHFSKSIMYIMKNILPPNFKILNKAKNKYELSFKKMCLIYLYVWKLKLYSVNFFIKDRCNL